MNKKVVFVGVPMSGKDEAMIERAIQVAKRDYLHLHKLSAKEVDFVDNRDFMPDPETLKGTKHQRALFVGRAIMDKIASCDEAVFGEGWEKAPGCRIEGHACIAYDIPVTRIYREKETKYPFTKWLIYDKDEIVNREMWHVSILAKNQNGDDVYSEVNP